MITIVHDTANGFIGAIEKNTDLPLMLQAVGLAFLTILIPVAIAIFEQTDDFKTLDRNVVLDHVVMARSLLVSLALIFLPLLFWNYALPMIKIFEIILWASGVICMIKILIRSYHWMKGNRFALRFDYLRSLMNKRDIEDSWRSVWQNSKITPENEQEFLDIFSSLIDKLLEDEQR